MTTNQILNNHLARPLSSPFLGTALWKTAGDRVVSILIKNKLGLTALGLATGVATVMAVDYVFRKINDERCNEYPSTRSWRGYLDDFPLDKHVVDRTKTILFSIPLVTGIAALALWIFNKNPFHIPFIILGSTIGSSIQEYYFRNSNQKVDEFIRWLKKVVQYPGPIEFRKFKNYLNYVNLSKLREKLQENFPEEDRLVLDSFKLTDKDLVRFKDAGWFNGQFKEIQLSQNHKITGKGLTYIAQNSKITLLDLTETDLTDDDLIEMAESGYFNELWTLKIGENPKITGKGLAHIAQKGFEKLNRLDLIGNSQLLGQGLGDWIETGGFKNLNVLEMPLTDITTDDWEKMIEKAEWFRKLSGLNLNRSERLRAIPSNISKMTNITEHGISDSVRISGGRIYFWGNGIFLGVDSHFDRKGTLELFLAKKLLFT